MINNALKAQWGDVIVTLEPDFAKWLGDNMPRLRAQYEAEVTRIAKVHQAVVAHDPNRPPFETFKNAICRGSYVFGNHCGNCEKCSWEREHFYFAKLSEKFAPTPLPVAHESAAIPPQPFAGVKSDDRTNHHN